MDEQAPDPSTDEQTPAKPVMDELILTLDHQIRTIGHHLEIAKKRRRRSHLSLVFGPVLLFLLYCIWWLPWISRTFIFAIYAPAAIVVIWCIIDVSFLKKYPGGPVGEADKGANFIKAWQQRRVRRQSEGDLELKFAQKRDERKRYLASNVTDIEVRRTGYKEDASSDIDHFRSKSNSYKRVNNILQGILIIGSLAATGVSGLSGEFSFLRWVTFGITFVVGIASGFMAYFKFKERSLYLQQTADAIEQEWEAVEVGVGRYKDIKEESERLKKFVEEVHQLKAEQRKRQQNLEQSAESREAAD